MRNFAFTLLVIVFSFVGCRKKSMVNDPISSDRLKITVGSAVFTATLYDNATVNALKLMLPLTINMSELNGNEKFYDFANNLPSNAGNPGSIQNGDIMLYGNRTLVLFYKSFSTSYNYTRIGKVVDISGWADALGSGSITVRYELE